MKQLVFEWKNAWISIMTLALLVVLVVLVAGSREARGEENYPPHAEIEGRSHHVALLGQEVGFFGSATDSDDGEVVRYVWNSSIDGEFHNGTEANVTTSGLSPGAHDISFRAQDDDGAWSNLCSTGTFQVIELPKTTPPLVNCEQLENADELNKTVTFRGSLSLRMATTIEPYGNNDFQRNIIEVSGDDPSVHHLDYILLDKNKTPVTGVRGKVKDIYGLDISVPGNDLAFNDNDRDGKVSGGDSFFMRSVENGGFAKEGYSIELLTNNVEKVEISFDDGAWVTVEGTESWSYKWNTKNVDNGNHTVRMRSWDGTNFSNLWGGTVTVANPDDDGGFLPGFSSALLVVGIVVLLGFYRKKK